MQITDQCNRQIKVPASPRRIVSVVPSQTELLYDLGLQEHIVGVTWFCVHPEKQVKKAAKAGGTKNLKTGVIHELRPDLIIANKEENDRRQIEELAAHYPVYVSDVKHLDDALDMIRQVGYITGKEREGSNLAGRISAAFHDLPARNSRGRVLYMIWRKPWMTVGGDTFISSMIRAAGFENATARLTRYPELSAEDIQSLNPDHIFLSSEPYPFKETHFAEFREWAPRAGIKLVNGEMFSWYGSHLLKAAGYFSQLNI